MRAAAEVIRSGQLASAGKVAAFENAVCARQQVFAAAAVSSGTAALHLTLLALGVGARDEVIIPSFVCSALLNAVRYVGATPVLAEIDPETLNIDPQDVRRRVTRRTRAVIVPHLFGLPAEIFALKKLHIPLIEDCAQALGANIGQHPVGSLGEAAVFSFYATKVITTGEGGMAASQSAGLVEQIQDLREYDQRKEDRIRYNYKMTDLQAAIGLVQLQRLDSFIRRRKAIAERYRQILAPLPVRLPPDRPDHIYYRFVIGLNTDASGWIRRLSEKGIDCERPVFMPLHRQLGLGGYPETERAWGRCLSIPIYPALSDEQVEHIGQLLAETAKGESRG